MPEVSESDELEAALRFKPFPEYDISLSLELTPQVPAEPSESASADAGDAAGGEGADPRTAFGETRLYFEGVPMTKTLAKIEPWGPEEAPVLLAPGSTEIVQAERGKMGEKPLALSRPAEATLADSGSEPKREPVTVAAKGAAPGEPQGFNGP